MRNRAPLYISDFETDDDVAGARSIARSGGYRSMVVVPMLRRDEALGAIAVTRREPGGFTNEEIALLQTFADQAVIAIENVRLFTELQEKNSALTQAHKHVTEALEQQTATAEILQVISQSQTNVQPVFETIVERAVRLCEGLFGTLFTFDGELMHLAAAHNWTPAAFEIARRIVPLPPNRATVSGRAILDRDVVHVPDVELDAEWQLGLELSREIGFRSALAVPMLRHGVPLGAMGVGRAEAGPFSDNQVALLKAFADQAVIAIENVRLFTELQDKNRALTEAHAQVTQALDQQTATSEVLRAIAHAQTDAQPVFDTIVRNATRLCQAAFSFVFLTDGRMLYHPASDGSSSEAVAAVRALFPRPLDKETVAGTAILTRSVVHIPDVREPSAAAFARQTGQAVGYRGLLSVPMLRQGEALGAISVS